MLRVWKMPCYFAVKDNESWCAQESLYQDLISRTYIPGTMNPFDNPNISRTFIFSFIYCLNTFTRYVYLAEILLTIKLSFITVFGVDDLLAVLTKKHTSVITTSERMYTVSCSLVNGE